MANRRFDRRSFLQLATSGMAGQRYVIAGGP